MSETGKPGLMTRIADHPFGKLVFGFLLTGFLGQSISWAYNERNARIAQRREALAAIREFTALEEAVRQRADRFRDAIVRGAPSDYVTLRADAYHTAYVDWGSAVDANHLRFREFFGFTDTNFVEAAIEAGLVPAVETLDACVSDAEIAYAMEDDATSSRDALLQCGDTGFDGIQERIHNCSFAISTALTHFVMVGLECGDDEWRSGAHETYDRLMASCVSPSQERIPFQWPYLDAQDEAYDASCLRDDLWFHRLGRS